MLINQLNIYKKKKNKIWLNKLANRMLKRKILSRIIKYGKIMYWK